MLSEQDKPSFAQHTESYNMLTRNVRSHLQKRSRIGMPNNFVHGVVVQDRDKLLDSRHTQPDLVLRKKQESHPYHPQHGKSCTVDGTPLALVEKETREPRYLVLSDLHEQAEHIREQNRNRYLYNMPSSDWA